MRDNKSSSSHLSPLLLRSLSGRPIQQAIESPEHTPARWMSKTTAIGHLTKLRRRGRASAQAEAATGNSVDLAEPSSQGLPVVQTSVDTKNDEHVDSPVVEHPMQSPELVTPSTLAKRMQDMLSTIPSFSPSIGSRASLPTPPTPKTESGDTPPVQDPHLLSFLTLPNFENGSLEHGWKSLCSTLDRLRPTYGKTTGTPEPSRDDVLDCIDDNNSIMMYGPLEPDDTSEVEIACSEIVSINGDGEEIRTPQPCYTPLPSESVDEALMGRGLRSPPPRFVSLPLESVDPALGSRSPRSTSPRFLPLPLESIDQVLMGGSSEASGVRWKESEPEIVPGTASPTQVPPTTGPAAGQQPVKEYRVWLPSPTKISIQTMWWGFRM